MARCKSVSTPFSACLIENCSRRSPSVTLTVVPHAGSVVPRLTCGRTLTDESESRNRVVRPPRCPVEPVTRINGVSCNQCFQTTGNSASDCSLRSTKVGSCGELAQLTIIESTSTVASNAYQSIGGIVIRQ